MSNSLNTEAIIGLAITTAIFRSDFDNQTKPHEIDEDDSWDFIAKLAIENLNWVGMDTSNLLIDKYLIAHCMWGMTPDELNQELLG